MSDIKLSPRIGRRLGVFGALGALLLSALAPSAQAITVNVVDANGNPIGVGFRWTLEEDATWAVTPGETPPGCTVPADPVLCKTQSMNLHRSYMPVVAAGDQDSVSDIDAAITAHNPVAERPENIRYYLSVLPNANGANKYTMSGVQIAVDMTDFSIPSTVTVRVNEQPVPTAQVFLRAFEDNAPINNVWDNGERPLGGWRVFIYDLGGQMMTDVYGNPLGTVYEGLADGAPRVKRLGDGSIHTMTAAEAGDPNKNPYGLVEGEALIKNIAPGKYGVQVIPPDGEGWVQTATIEGTRGLDVWVKAAEPRYFAEFGPAGHHAEFGFVREFNNLGVGSNTITGRVVNKHMARPPDYSTFPGHPLPSCWVGVNNQAGTVGLYAAPCDAESKFRIEGVPDGTYTLVFWDEPLLNVFAFQTVTVGPDATATLCPGGLSGSTCDVGDVQQFMWFGNHHHWAFFDDNENGRRDPGEAGIPDQVVNLRYRDGSIYGSSTTDTEGFLPFEEVFPFFSFLVAEIDFARFKATGLTVTVDAGGEVNRTLDGTGECADPIGRCQLTPQIQSDAEGNADDGYKTRTELGPVLTEGYNAFLGMTNVFEWGKKAYGPGENGGISGIVHYAVTIAENDPRFAAAEDWEPGIPRVQVNLYQGNPAGEIQDVNGSTFIELSDVDNYPFGWADGGAMGPEDVKRNGDTACVADLSCVFNAGDAINVAYTDSFDDNPPTGCPGQQATATDPNPTNDPFYMGGKCYDGLRNYNQVRPTVFDGGFAFFDYVPGGASSGAAPATLISGQYVVEAVTPNAAYRHVTEESKNVDYGDEFTLSPFALPPACVGELHTVGDGTYPPKFLDFVSEFDGEQRPLCDRKSVLLSDGKNPGVDFFMYTDVPVAGHIQGFVLNDLANEFNQLSPNFGEKFAPSWIPVSVRDFAGNEVYHTYTDEWGTYNAIVPSTYTMNAPAPTGVSPNMLQVCLNSPVKWGGEADGWVPEPRFNKQYTQFCYTLNFSPGTTTYLDTPVLPIAAFAGPGNYQLDCEYPDQTPVISYVMAPGVGGGPWIPADNAAHTLRIFSAGNAVEVQNPGVPRTDGNNGATVVRDFGFGPATSTPRVFLGDVELTDITFNNPNRIDVTVPAGTAGGQLRVVRGDSGLSSVTGITVTVGGTIRRVGVNQTIQQVIDAADPGDLVMVRDGTYMEMLVMTKPIQLQGWGPGVTAINPVQSPTDKITLWRQKVNSLANCSHQIGLLPSQPNNTAGAGQPCGFAPGTGLFATEEGAGILVAPVAGAFGTAPARIDGFTITGADQSGAIIVNGYATGLEISNNILSNNQGPSAAGIRVGPAALIGPDDFPVDAQNDNVNIHHNHVTQNGGLFEPGAGIGLYTGSDNYRVTNNNVCGNFAMSNGGGIAHYGLSNNGLIADNHVLFNQSFDQTILTGGYGGGVLVSGYEAPAGAAVALSPGSGSVRIERNRIQGNQAGSGNGGGIALRFVNGAEAAAAGSVGQLYRVDIAGNEIVNNVTGVAGGGISLEDALSTFIVNNTIANNDSTATAGAALTAAGTATIPQPAGLVAFANTAPLNAVASGLGLAAFSNPLVRNNILLGNRSQYWTTANDNCPADTTTGVRNCLMISEFNDVDVLGVAGDLTVEAGLLTDTTRQYNLYNDGVNQMIGLTISATNGVDADEEKPYLVDPYFNGPPCFDTGCISVQPNGTLVTPEQTTGLAVAAATDEGGNFIDVHYGPLSPLGDYHLAATSSAIDTGLAGSVVANAGLDIDRQVRPVDSGDTGGLHDTTWDIGSDEASAEAPGAGDTCVGNVDPTIDVGVAPDGGVFSWFGYVNAPFRMQLRATDPNAGQGIRYAATGLPTGLEINAMTGVVSGLPTAATGSYDVTFEATDVNLQGVVCGGSSSQVVTIVIGDAGGAPTATNDNYRINTNGAYTEPAPGVLQTDSNATSARLVDVPIDGGSVALQADGGFTFTPKPDFVGLARFRYRALNAAGVESNLAVVNLRRNIAVVDAMFYSPLAASVDGTWTIQGVADPSIAGEGLDVRLIKGDGSPFILLGSVPAGANWSLTVTGPRPVTTGAAPDSIQVFSTVHPGRDTLNGVAIYNKSQAGAPNSTAYVQCPGDTDGDANIDDDGAAAMAAGFDPAHVKCEHLGAGDGFAVMADGKELYTFGFNSLKGVPQNLSIDKGILNAQWSSPTLEFDEGDHVFLTLTNVGMLMRPDLFDPHTVHFHGFPNAASVFDGVPDSSIAINMMSSLTYYWNIQEPGTYMYHCHVEAAEHMQMGMLGNLFVNPKQNGESYVDPTDGETYDKFVYNDQDGTTGYDVQKAIQIGSFDSNFHEQHIAVQPLPFAEMKDDYPMLNGRGYPDTVKTAPVPVKQLADGQTCDDENAPYKLCSGVTSAEESSQKEDSRVVANVGERILLRISNLNVTQFYTLGISGGLSMKVVGRGAHILRGPAAPGAQGTDLYYETQSVTLGGGEAVDVLIDTSTATPGTYLLYSTNLNELSNGPQDFGGMMTEIVINP